MSKYVLKLLESYNERERKIAVLRYNLEHPAKVSRSEQIEAMNFGHGDGLDHSAGHISNKTLYIALNYEEQAERMNAESAHEIAKELFALECEQRRLTYFIRTLDLPPLISVPDLIETAKMELEWLCIQLSFLRIFLLSYKCKYATFSHIISMIIDILTFL